MASDLTVSGMKTLLRQLVLLDTADTTTLAYTASGSAYTFDELDLLNEAYHLVWAQSGRRFQDTSAQSMTSDTWWNTTTQGNFYTKILSAHLGAFGTASTILERSSFGEMMERRAHSQTSAAAATYWAAWRGQSTGTTNYGRWVVMVHPQPEDAYELGFQVEVEAVDLVDDSESPDLDPWEVRIVVRLAAAEAADLLGRTPELIEGILAQVPERYLISRTLRAHERLPDGPGPGTID